MDITIVLLNCNRRYSLKLTELVKPIVMNLFNSSIKQIKNLTKAKLNLVLFKV